MDDEYFITLALMHGCEFHPWASGVQWYIEATNNLHEVERWQFEKTGHHYWRTREALARDYCKFYKLGTYGGNDER